MSRKREDEKPEVADAATEPTAPEQAAPEAAAPAEPGVEGSEQAPPATVAGGPPARRVTVFLTEDSPQPTYTDDQTHLVLTREPQSVAAREISENTRRQPWVTIEREN